MLSPGHTLKIQCHCQLEFCHAMEELELAEHLLANIFNTSEADTRGH